MNELPGETWPGDDRPGEEHLGNGHVANGHVPDGHVPDEAVPSEGPPTVSLSIPVLGGGPEGEDGSVAAQASGAPGERPTRRPRRAARRRSREVEVLVVGAGPAGLAAATALCQAGIGAVEVVEREPEAGGMPRHCHHTGYGLHDLRRMMNGPEYARWHVAQTEASGAEVRTGISVTGWVRPPAPGEPIELETTGSRGLERVAAGAVLLATGARERPRPARLVPGDRGEGVLTTGLLQQLVQAGLPVGRRAVVVGAEHVSFSAVLTLRQAGVEVAAMVTDQPRHQTWSALRAGVRLRFGVPVLSSSTVERVVGRSRVQAVEVRRGNGRVQVVECDTVVFTGDWVPDHELARLGGLAIDPGTRGPRVDTGLRTSLPGVFAVGNLVHPVEPADLCALRARAVVPAVRDHLAGKGLPLTVGVEPGGGFGRVAPNLVAPQGPRPPRGDFLLWPTEFGRLARISVQQGDRELYRTRAWRLVPNRPYRLAPRWQPDVDASPSAAPVTISRAPGQSSRQV
jgi:thioredoxin reductase